MLSACGTALGRVTGEGTLGFTRSFLAAGARAVVATTWEMPDTAGLQMMDAFYAARVAGAGVSDALRTAQLRTLRALRAGRITMKAGAPGADAAGDAAALGRLHRRRRAVSPERDSMGAATADSSESKVSYLAGATSSSAASNRAASLPVLALAARAASNQWRAWSTSPRCSAALPR